MKKESLENYIRNLKGHIYTNKIMVVLYEETRYMRRYEKNKQIKKRGSRLTAPSI